MADRVIETQLRFITDRQATNQVLRDNARIGDGLQDIARSSEKTEAAYSDQEKAAIRLAKAQREAIDASVRAAKEQSELFGDVASRSSQLSGALTGLGAVGGQRLMIATDILDAVEASQLLRAEFPAMAQQLVTNAGGVKNLAMQLGVMAAVTGGLVLAYKAVSSATEASRKQVERFIAIQRELAQVQTAGLTTSEIKNQIEQQQKLNDIRREEIAALEAERDARVGELSRLELVGEVTGVANQGIDDLNARLGELNTQIAVSDRVIQKLNESLTTEQRVTNELRDEINTRVNAEIELFRLLEDGTTESIQARIKAIENEIEVNQRAVDELEELNLATQNFDEDLALFKGNITDLENELSVLAQALPQVTESEAIKAYNEAIAKTNDIDPDVVRRYNEELKRQQQIMEAPSVTGGVSFAAIEAGAQAIANAEAERAQIIRETEAQIIEAETNMAAKRADLIADTESKIADLAADFAQERLEAERDYRESIAELTRDYQQDTLKDLEDFQRDQRRSEEDHRDNMLDAVGRLDAVALLNEQRNFEKEQKRAKEDFKTEQERRKKEFDQRLKDEERAFKMERQQAERSYRERERDLRDSLNRQLSDLRTAHAREIADIRGHQNERITAVNTALDAELRALTGFTQEEQTVRNQHYVQMLDALQTFVSDANATVAGLTAGGGSTGTVPDTPGAVGQFPLSAGLRAPGGLASPFSSPMAMMPPVSRAVNTSTNTAQITNYFNGMDRLTPGQVRNVVKIANQEFTRAIS